MGFLLWLKYRNKQKLPRRGKTLDPNTSRSELNQAGSGVSGFQAECPWRDRPGGLRPIRNPSIRPGWDRSDRPGGLRWSQQGKELVPSRLDRQQEWRRQGKELGDGLPPPLPFTRARLLYEAYQLWGRCSIFGRQWGRCSKARDEPLSPPPSTGGGLRTGGFTVGRRKGVLHMRGHLLLQCWLPLTVVEELHKPLKSQYKLANMRTQRRTGSHHLPASTACSPSTNACPR